MKPLRVFALDDEPAALRRLSIKLAEVPGVALAGSDTNPRRAVDRIRELKPDVLLLDIAMPGLNGFEVIGRLEPDSPPAVIFVTGFDQHAVSAFEASALDYLLKPVSSERLSFALARARAAVDALNSGGKAEELLEVVNAYRSRQGVDSSAGTSVHWAQRGRALIKVPVSEIWWVKSEGDYVRLYSKGGGAVIRETLTRLVANLDPGLFLRIHRSVVVRKNQIRSVRRRRTGALVAELACGDIVPVGRQYARGIRDLMSKIDC